MATPTKWSSPNITAPAMAYVSISPGNSILGGFKALYVGGTGNILLYSFESVINSTGSITNESTTLFVNAQAGSILPLMGLAIGTTASGTTATDLVALG